MKRLVAGACLGLILVLVGCGYAVRLASPETWWADGGATGPDGITRQPMIRR
jgi:hypothetical protein